MEITVGRGLRELKLLQDRINKAVNGSEFIGMAIGTIGREVYVQGSVPLRYNDRLTLKLKSHNTTFNLDSIDSHEVTIFRSGYGYKYGNNYGSNS